jgi:hypothetical protein
MIEHKKDLNTKKSEVLSTIFYPELSLMKDVLLKEIQKVFMLFMN